MAWQVDPSIRDAEFYVYRKWDSGAEWELLNTQPVYGNGYADKEFVIKNKSQVPAYRVLAIKGELEWDSPEVAVFDHVSRKEFGIAQNIIRGLYLQARHDGIPVLYYPAVKNGAMSGSLDPDTGQRIANTDCEMGNVADDENDYGTYYKGGYYRPFLTFIRPMQPKLVREDRLDVGVFDSNIIQTYFLPFPSVRSGDMVVDVATDRRWIIGEGVTSSNFASKIPVLYQGEMSLQAHNDPCYKVPVPTNYSHMIRHFQCR